MRNTKKAWTPEDEEFLLESYGVAGIQFMMDRLGRSAESIRQKHQLLTGMANPREAAGSFTAREAADVLGVDHNTILDWIDKRKFPAKQFLKLRKDNRKRVYSIDPFAMWKWVGKNRERVNFAHVKTGIILPEPDWLPEEIKKAHVQPIKRPKSWTKEETETAWFWYRTGVPYQEIAKRLNRPEKGTWAKLNRLAKKKVQEKIK